MKPARAFLLASATFLLGLAAGVRWSGPESRRDEVRGEGGPPGLGSSLAGSTVSDVSHARGGASKESGGTRSLSLGDVSTVLKAQLAAGLSADGTLREPFCAALGLTPEEKSEVERAIADTRREMRALEEKNVRIISQTDEVAECEVARFPEEGARLEAALRKSVGDTLGPERAEAFFELGRLGLAEPLSHFGQLTRRIVARYGPHPIDPAQKGYRFSEGWFDPDVPEFPVSTWGSFGPDVPPELTRLFRGK